VPICSIITDDKGANMPCFKEDLMRYADALHLTEPGCELLALGHITKLLEISLRFRPTPPHVADWAVR